jgi:hypothetical protein
MSIGDDVISKEKGLIGSCTNITYEGREGWLEINGEYEVPMNEVEQVMDIVYGYGYYRIK